MLHRAVVVAQLAEWSFLIPEIRGSNPVIAKIYNEHFTVPRLINCWKDENKQIEAGNGQF